MHKGSRERLYTRYETLHHSLTNCNSTTDEVWKLKKVSPDSDQWGYHLMQVGQNVFENAQPGAHRGAKVKGQFDHHQSSSEKRLKFGPSIACNLLIDLAARRARHDVRLLFVLAKQVQLHDLDAHSEARDQFLHPTRRFRAQNETRHYTRRRLHLNNIISVHIMRVFSG